MGIDILTVGVGVLTFGIFLLIHLVTFRRMRPEKVLRSLFVCVVAMTMIPVPLLQIFCTLKVVSAPPLVWLGAALSAIVIEGLLCVFYVLCIFGPYETSVRMRLVREIAKASSDGISMEELLKKYDSSTMVDMRLRRLMGSGDIIEKDGIYRAGSGRNIFFIFDAIAGMIKKWIGRERHIILWRTQH